MKPFDPDLEFTGALSDGVFCANCDYFSLRSWGSVLRGSCSTDEPERCPGVKHAVEAYISDNGWPGLLDELTRRNPCDDLLCAYIAQNADLTIEDAEHILSAFKFWSTLK